MLNAYETIKQDVVAGLKTAKRFVVNAIKVIVLVLISGITIGAAMHLWFHDGPGRPTVTTVHSEYTGTFGGHCDPGDHLVCVSNTEKVVTVGDQTFINGLKPHSHLPINGTSVAVTVKKVMVEQIIKGVANYTTRAEVVLIESITS